MMTVIWIILILSLTQEGESAEMLHGEEVGESCVCMVNSTLWTFPIIKYEDVNQRLQTCTESLQLLRTQTLMISKNIPSMKTRLDNVTVRLQRFRYLNTNGLYNALHLDHLSNELKLLEHTVKTAHLEQVGADTNKISSELRKFQEDVNKMYKDNIFNMETMRERLRSLSNRVQTCRTIPQEFRSSCSQRLIRNISEPVITKLNPFSKSYISGAWGHDYVPGIEEKYWIQPLVSGHRSGNTVRFYSSYEDFMAGKNHKDEVVATSHTHPDAIQGPGSIVYDGVIYYQCYNSDELCSFDSRTKKIRRLKLGAGINNKFPYCYYTCRDWTDVTLSVDHKGLWVMYATDNNHGNMVISRVDLEHFNVTHTWKTQVFKRSVTSTFVICGVVYATRYIDIYKEEVFYAFDTSTGMEDNTLSLSLEKVAAGVASLHYNRNDMKLYMYNDGYLLAYQAQF